MRFYPKRNARLSRRQRFIRATYFILIRSTATLCFASVALILFLTSLGRSPPPPALLHASGGRARRNLDLRECGCSRADHCSTSVPVGSFEAPHVSRYIDQSLSKVAFENEKRSRTIRSATMGAWDAYVASAWGFDELKPLSGTGEDALGGLAATIVESLSTLYIMRLPSRYEAAREWIERNLLFENVSHPINVHEVTTRILGGLVSIYQLTGDDMYLSRAEDLGMRLRPAFDSLNGIPYPFCRLASIENSTVGEIELPCSGDKTTQSAAGGLSLEFRALSFHSLDPDVRILRCKVDRAVQAVVEAGPELLRDEITGEIRRKEEEGGKDSLHAYSTHNVESSKQSESRFTTMHSYYAYMVEVWQDVMSAIGGGPTVDTTATFAAPARGFYEYLTKAWRQGGSCESYLRFPLDASMHVLLRKAIFESPTGELYLKSFDGTSKSADEEAVVEQSMCYLPAVFQLAAQYKNISVRQEEQWRDVAEGITKSCISMYEKFPSGLGGDSVRYDGRKWKTDGVYRLQPDLVEALFYMWRATGDQKYKEEAWKTFMSITRECRLENGAFTVLEESEDGNVTKGDRMPSYLIGSTLKFLFLTFAENSVLPLDNWVFNRAAQPLLVSPGIGALNPCQTEVIR